MSPDFRSLPYGSLNSGESSYLKVRHGVAFTGEKRTRLRELVLADARKTRPQ